MKILFVYPNINTELRIPLAISILIAQLRILGHEVKLFDSTFYGDFHTDNEKMSSLGTHKQTDLLERVGEVNKTTPEEALNNTIGEFKPDFIFVSCVERNFRVTKELLKDINIPILMGGIFPTIAPEFCKSQDWIDYICIGEGENVLKDFLDNPKDLFPKSLINMDDVPEQDWSDFDDRHLLKPFMGRVYRGGAFEFSRGCFKSCSFCVAPKIRKAMEGCGKYHRTKSPIHIINEIANKVNLNGLQMLSFGDTDFLHGVPKKILLEFLQMYAEIIQLPFTIQASVQTLLDEDVLKMLRMAQCCAISVGVESGSYKIQKEVLKKVLNKDMVKRAFDLCRKHELRVTANYMIGLPHETEDDVYETIKFNRVINPPSIAVTFFTPFMGTELYDVCIKEGFYRPFQENVYDYPPLDMPQLKQERIKSLVREFTDDFKTYQNDFNIAGENNAK